MEYRRNGQTYRSDPGTVGAEWAHVTLTVTDTELSWFVDGEPAGTNPIGSGGFPAGTSAVLTLGKRVPGGALVEGFAIDDLAFHDQVIPGGHGGVDVGAGDALGVGGSVSYRYDGAGRRVEKTVGDATTRYRWDTLMAVPDVVEQDNPDGTSTTTVFGPTGPLQTRTGSAGSPGAWEFLHQDALGSTVAVSNSTGEVIGERRYSVFGDRWNESGVMSAAAQRFATGSWDAETGLWFLKARYLDPTTAMFLSRDPIPTPVGQAH